MSVQQGKRKRQDMALTNEERIVYNIIHDKKETGIYHAYIKQETKTPIPDTKLKNTIKSLLSKSLIKEVVNIQNKSRKLLMAVEFQPSKEISGGDWYTDGELDSEFIDSLSKVCFMLINRHKVVTCDGILEWLRTDGSAVFTGGVTEEQVEQILKILVLDRKVQEVTSNGVGDFDSVPVGGICYIVRNNSGGGGAAAVGDAMVSIPCGVCPRINFCSPEGVVNPTNCEYYQKWLDF